VKSLCELKGSVKEPNMFHDYETEKVTRKASDAAETCNIAGETMEQHAIIAVFCHPLALRVIVSGETTEQRIIIIITSCSVVPPEKITRKASDMADNLQL